MKKHTHCEVGRCALFLLYESGMKEGIPLPTVTSRPGQRYVIFSAMLAFAGWASQLDTVGPPVPARLRLRQ